MEKIKIKRPYILLDYPDNPELRNIAKAVYSVQGFRVLPVRKFSVLPVRKNDLSHGDLDQASIRESRERMINFLRDLDDYSKYEIVYLKKRGEPYVQIFFLIHSEAWRFFGENIYEKSFKSCELIKELFRDYFPEYNLIPIEKKSELVDIIEPFERKYFCSIKRRHGIAEVKNPGKPFFIKNDRKNLKELSKYPVKKIDGSYCEDYFYFVCPFIPKNNSFKGLLRILTETSQNLVLSVFLSKGMLNKRGFWRPLVRAYNEFKHHIEKLHNDSDIGFDLKETLMVYERMLDAPEDELRCMSIVLASDKKIKVELAKKVADEITETKEKELSYSGGYQLHFYGPKEHTLDEAERMFRDVTDLRTIFHIEEASCAFRLPVFQSIS